jgi:hypothetical protein
MPPTNNKQTFPLALVLLAAASGAVLTVIVGVIAMQIGPRSTEKAAHLPCECDEGAPSPASVQPNADASDRSDEVRRAFLAGLAQSQKCDEKSGDLAETQTAPDSPVEDEDDLEVPSPEDLAEQHKMEMATLDGEFDEEPVDATWARATEQEAERAIALTGSMDLKQVTCRASLCRVQVTHRDLGKREDDVEKLLGTIPAGGQARVYAPTDEPTTVMYFSREGKQLSVMTKPPSWVPLPPLAAANSAPMGDGENPAPVPP